MSRYGYQPNMRLTKEVGNAEAIKKNVDITLRRDGESKAAKEFAEEAKHIKKYDKVIELAKEYVNIKEHDEK